MEIERIEGYDQKSAIKEHDMDAFRLGLDTYESILDDERKIERVNDFRKCIQNN